MSRETCRNCGYEYPDTPGGLRVECPECGEKSRVFHTGVVAVVAAQARIEGAVLRLSVSASTSVVLASESFLGPNAFADSWPKIAQMKHDIEMNHGSEQALRLIQSGAFEHALGQKPDDRQIAFAQYAAAEILHARQSANDRLRDFQERKRSRCESLGNWLRSGVGWLLGLFR